ncbi:MAG: LexA family transcriptional regulator [Magnetococcales bacterium]|nr:LexA family transcriptional regulator [Magnetococcales bacterium]MBF0437748.1 LexA family transcriptional regulator [Magnetococcales bacterium]
MSPINRDSDHLSRLQDYYARYRVWPSYAQLGEVLGLSAKSAVAKFLHRLEVAGFIQRTPDGAWSPMERFFERPLAETTVRAGLPEMVLDAADNPVLIDSLLVNTPSRTVVLPVKGDSMRDAGIYDGDLVVVERGQVANSGALVVAEVDGEFTLKTLMREDQLWALHPANPDYPILYPKQSLTLFGVVTGLIRRYNKP